MEDGGYAPVFCFSGYDYAKQGEYMKCLNCDSEATVKVLNDSSEDQFYCDFDVPAFLKERGSENRLVTLAPNEPVIFDPQSAPKEDKPKKKKAEAAPIVEEPVVEELIVEAVVETPVE